MIYLFLEMLRSSFGLHIPHAFTYYSTRMMLASITSFLLSIFLGPYFIRKLYELKIGQSIRMEECPLLGELHAKKKDTPTMGGVLILASMLISLFLWMDLSHIYTLILLLTTLALGTIGGYDDYLKLKYKNTKGLPARYKMLFQLFISCLVGIYLLFPTFQNAIKMGNWYAPPVVKEHKIIEGKAVASTIQLHEFAARLYVPFLKDFLFSFKGIFFLFALLFFIAVITGTSNAVNLTDGLDGLAAGCLIMSAGCFALFAFLSNHIEMASYLNIAYIEGSGEIAIYLASFLGATLGFLWYNAHPAQVFMGDIGSLTLGGILGVSAVLLKRELLLLIVGGVFAMEALSVILQVGSYKFRNQKRIFLIAPLHHHFEYKGWHEVKVVMRFWIVAFLLAIVGIATLKFQ